MGRARSQIGAPARSNTQGLFSPLLRRVANTLPPTERVPVKEAKPNGAAAASRASFPDESLAAMRYDREVKGLSVNRCAKKYGIGVSRAEAMLAYITRADVKPAPFQPAQGGVGADEAADSLVAHVPQFCPAELLNTTQQI
jgi:hypothetical protein